VNGIVEQSDRARRDLIRILIVAGQSKRSAVRRLRAAAETTFGQLASMTGVGEPFDPEILGLAPIRRCLITGYKNDLVYSTPIEGGIRFLRVVHAAREPEDLVEPDDFD